MSAVVDSKDMHKSYMGDMKFGISRPPNGMSFDNNSKFVNYECNEKSIHVRNEILTLQVVFEGCCRCNCVLGYGKKSTVSVI